MKPLMKLAKAIKGQQDMIRRTGFEPTWELFEMTFGWFQISKDLTNETKETYKQIWNIMLNR